MRSDSRVFGNFAKAVVAMATVVSRIMEYVYTVLE